MHQIFVQYLITWFGHYYWDQMKGLLSSKAQFILDAKLLCHHANANLRSQQSPKNLEKSTISKNDKNSCGAILKTDPALRKLLIDYSSTNLTTFFLSNTTSSVTSSSSLSPRFTTSAGSSLSTCMKESLKIAEKYYCSEQRILVGLF